MTTDELRFNSHDGPKINYSNQKFDTEFLIKPIGLLHEEGISVQEIIISKWQELPIFYKSSEEEIPFDIFSATFFLVSRYEEYLPHIKDHHGRYTAEESIAYKYQFLDKPLVNQWIKAFKNILLNRFKTIKFPEQKFSFQSTIDVDAAYYFLEKGIVRTTASFIKSAIELDKEMIQQRKDVLLGRIPDPYDTFELQIKLNKKYNIDTVYFILLADYGLNDKNNLIHSRKFQLLVKHLADNAEVAIHPSYASNSNFETLVIEKNRLERIVKKEVKNSRQHFLKLDIPFTYRNLLELSIENDFSMGYASQPGFRASICTPYYFYDLELETSTNLKIHPFAVMDATFNYYLKLSPEKSFFMIKQIIDIVKAVDGHFISLWHNETWSEYKKWKGWSKLYLQMIEYIHKC
ncbi:MAG: polysaccharide deacetylase family protein [Flavobacteriales bacterium]